MKSNVLSQHELVEFLLQAKRETYATGGSDSPAIVPAAFQGSHQLEYQLGDLLYRDIYFGAAYFVGLETIYQGLDAIWAMSYAGGWTEALPDPAEMVPLGRFLQSALQHVPTQYPFRGPLEYRETVYLYRNMPTGDVARFSGVEHINLQDVVIYQLHYNGGMLL